MPIPKPDKNEKKDDFISRCMGNATMVKDYPDNKQRAAVCYKSWEDKEMKSNIPEIERRAFDITELRVIKEPEKKPRIRGYAAVFNKLSEPMWGFREKIAPGTFKNSIVADDIRALVDHESSKILGRNKSGTLTLTEDENGLFIDIEPGTRSYELDVMQSIERGDVSQMSFGFIAIKDEWEHEKGKESIRTLKEVKLFDVSPVTYPAYPQTSVQVRDYLSALKEADSQGATDKQGHVEDELKQHLIFGIPNK